MCVCLKCSWGWLCLVLDCVSRMCDWPQLFLRCEARSDEGQTVWVYVWCDIVFALFWLVVTLLRLSIPIIKKKQGSNHVLKWAFCYCMLRWVIMSDVKRMHKAQLGFYFPRSVLVFPTRQQREPFHQWTKPRNCWQSRTACSSPLLF